MKTPFNLRFHKLTVGLAAIAALASFASTAQAATTTATWAGTSSADWDTPGNWTPTAGFANANTFQATIGNGTNVTNTTINLSTATAANKLTFGATSQSFTVTGGTGNSTLTIDVNSAITTENSVATFITNGAMAGTTQTISANLNLNNSATYTGTNLGPLILNTGSGNLTLSGKVSVATAGAAPTFLYVVGGAGTTSLSGGIGLPTGVALQFSGAGTGAINFSPTGTPTVNLVDVIGSNTVNLGTSFTANVATGNAINLGNGTINSVTGSPTQGLATALMTGSGTTLTLTLNAGAAGSGTMADTVVAGQTITFGSNNTSGSAVTNTLAGKWSLGTSISGSGTGVQTTNAFAAANNTLVLNGVVSGTLGAAQSFVLGGGVSGAAGTVEFKGANTYTAPTSFANGATAEIAVNSTTTTTGVTNGAFGTGTVNLTGGTVENDGTARTVSNAVTLGGTAILQDGTAVTGTGLTFGAGNITNGANTFTLTANSTVQVNNTTSIAETINDGGGSLSLTKTGTGTLLLNAANTYTGGTVVNGGVVEALATSALNGPLTVTTGTVDLEGVNQAVGDLSGTGGTIVNNATGTGASLTVGTGNTGGATYSGIIADHTTGTGTLSLIKTGTGTTTLSGDNTYSGGTSVNGGILYADNATSSTGSGSVNINAGGTFGGSGSVALGTTNKITVAATGNLTPGDLQSVPLTGTPGTSAAGNLTVTSSGGTTLASPMVSVAASATLATPQLTFALGANGTSSKMVIGGAAANILSFNVGGTATSDTVVSINDLIGSQLTQNGMYVLIQGNGNTVYDNAFTGTALTTAVNGQILDGLTLQSASSGNFFSQWYGQSELFLVGDNIDVEVVPEPSTWALILGGFGLLVFITRRRNNV